MGLDFFTFCPKGNFHSVNVIHLFVYIYIFFTFFLGGGGVKCLYFIFLLIGL